MSDGFAADYVQVNERINHFYEKWPEGSIATDVLEFTPDRVMVRATVYRTPNDTHPTTGHSYMTIPGTTPYTKGSELENAETSAVGRALALMGFDTHKGVASAQEVAAKSVATPAPSAPQRPPTPVPDGTWACPEHGTARVKTNRKGQYCATKLDDGSWCSHTDSERPVERRPRPAEPPLPEPPADLVAAAQAPFDDLPF